MQVGSKSDKAASRAVKPEEGAALAARHGCAFCEVSAKTRHNVRKPFVELVDQIVACPELLAAARGGGGAGGSGTAGGAVDLNQGVTGWVGSACSC